MVAADSKAKFLHEAEKYILHGKVSQAIGEYLKIIKLDPNDVLTLNTIGDLYLRQHNIPEANKCFAQVAETYVRNNFFLKAIAVYRKILSTDPSNLQTNATIAALYAKQGSSVDARNQYLKVAALLEKADRGKEVLDVYEKIVELDPSNSTAQRKLAELHLAAGDNKLAHIHFTGAARAHLKSRDFAEAMDAFSRALLLDPTDVETLGGFLECCQETRNLAPVLDCLTKALEANPQDLPMRELLGQAYLAANDPESAANTFQMVFAVDDSRYEGFFAAAQSLIDKGSYIQAINCLDPIIPALITRRETERAAQFYEQILARCPGNILPLVKLASVYSATGDQIRYLDSIEKIADYYLDQKCHIEAIEYLEKIIHANPQSEKHLMLHRRIFAEAYPDMPYVVPMEPTEAPVPPSPVSAKTESVAPADSTTPELVEVDLLLNYGLKDKALSILQNLESSDPNDKEVRIRLLSVFKGENRSAEAAEQCMLLAALHRNSQDEEVALEYLSEARKLAPELVDEENLEAFARLRGIALDPSPAAASESDTLQSDSEIDLSADLMDIFFVGNEEADTDDEAEPQAIEAPSPETITEEFSQDLQRPLSKSIEEQLQEVDFYIRLGFNEEALGKLNELAKISPDDAGLAERYEKIGSVLPQPPVESVSLNASDIQVLSEPSPEEVLRELPEFPDVHVESVSQGFAIVEPEPAESKPVEEPTPIPPAASVEPFAEIELIEPSDETEAIESATESAIPVEPEKPDFHANEMFADLLNDVGAESSQEISAESFEDHFSLGIAYREMELLDEAIREFQNALKAADIQKDTEKLIQCCGMLSTCFLKKDMPSSVLHWCQKGLSIADISSHEAMALRYDMGIAHLMSGNNERALECFEWIFNIDSGYRNVAQRIDELKSGLNRHAP
jgi:tetratricopeptide (TPR) repeat protein